MMLCLTNTLPAVGYANLLRDSGFTITAQEDLSDAVLALRPDCWNGLTGWYGRGKSAIGFTPPASPVRECGQITVYRPTIIAAPQPSFWRKPESPAWQWQGCTG